MIRRVASRLPRRLLVLTIAAMFLAAATVAAQQVFRGRVDLVRVDVSVIENRTGKPVTDLKSEDFRVTENGTPQRIDAFAFQPVGPSPESALPQSSKVPVSPLAPHARRVFMIVFSGQQRGPYQSFDGTIRLIRNRLNKGDLVSVMALNRFIEATDDHEAVIRLIERLKASLSDEMFQVVLSRPARGVHADIPDARQTSIDRFLVPPGEPLKLRSATDLILNSAAFRQARAWHPWNYFVVVFDTLRLHAAIEYLRHIEGNKQLVLFTKGLMTKVTLQGMPRALHHWDRDDDVRLARRAADAGVALNVVNITGVDLNKAGGVGGFEDILSLQAVSEHSGGHCTGVRTADDQYERLDLATRSMYALGYSSSNPQLDGKFRNIRVTVKRRDVTVVYRQGYTAAPDIPPADLREILTAQRFREASATDLEPADLAVKVEASEADSSGRNVNVSLLIDGSRLSLEKQGDRWVGEIDLVVLAGTREDKVTGTVKQRMTLGMDEARYKQATTTGIPYSLSVPVTQRSASVKVMVYEFASDKMGVAVARIGSR